MTRLRLLARIVMVTVRRIAWPTLLATLAAGVAVAWLFSQPERASTEQVLTGLRWASVLLAAGLAGVLDDATESDLAGAGTPVWVRRLVAVAVALPATAAAWSLAVLVAGHPLPWAATTLEAAALVALGLAGASLRPVRRSSVPPALAAAPLPVLTLIAALLLPARWTLYALPDDPAWDAAHVRWALLGLAGLVVAALAARDPARRSPRRRLAPARPRSAPSSPHVAPASAVAPSPSSPAPTSESS